MSQAAPPELLAAVLAEKMTAAQKDEVEKATRKRIWEDYKASRDGWMDTLVRDAIQ